MRFRILLLSVVLWWTVPAHGQTTEAKGPYDAAVSQIFEQAASIRDPWIKAQTAAGLAGIFPKEPLALALLKNSGTELLRATPSTRCEVRVDENEEALDQITEALISSQGEKGVKEDKQTRALWERRNNRKHSSEAGMLLKTGQLDLAAYEAAKVTDSHLQQSLLNKIRFEQATGHLQRNDPDKALALTRRELSGREQVIMWLQLSNHFSSSTQADPNMVQQALTAAHTAAQNIEGFERINLTLDIAAVVGNTDLDFTKKLFKEVVVVANLLPEDDELAKLAFAGRPSWQPGGKEGFQRTQILSMNPGWGAIAPWYRKDPAAVLALIRQLNHGPTLGRALLAVSRLVAAQQSPAK